MAAENIEAIIFDMDGVIADTEKIHTLARLEILSEHDIDEDPEEIEKKYAGVSSEKMFSEVFEKHAVEANPRKSAEKKREKYHELLEGNIEPVPGVKKLVEELSENFPLAIATSSSHSNIDKIMAATGLGEFFEEKVSAKEKGLVGKPSPDVYLEAAERMGVNPGKCVAIEDGLKGMKSAKEAGMTVIAYSENSDTPQADRAFDDMGQIDSEKIRQIYENSKSLSRN